MVRAHYSVDRSIEEARLRWQGIDEAMDHCKFCEKLVARNKMQTHYLREHGDEWGMELEAKRERRLPSLSSAESTELAAHETVIEQGLKVFRAVGTALLAIRDKRLYRATHATFEDYLTTRWNLKRTRAYQLIEAAKVADELSTNGVQAPQNERQARALTEFPPENRATIAQLAAQTAKTTCVNVSSGLIKRVGEDLMAAIRTGAGDLGDGTSTVIGATNLNTQLEAMQRQRQHIRDNRTPPLANLETHIERTYKSIEGLYVTFQVDEEAFTRLREAHINRKPVRLVVYEVNHD